MKFVPVVCPKCGKQAEMPANGRDHEHASCPKKGRGPNPVYVEIECS